VTSRISLSDLERRAWRSVFQDGLWDIYLGLLLLAMGVGSLLSDVGASEGMQYGAYAALIGLSMLQLWAGKRFLTLPRMGQVRFGPRRKTRLNVVRAVLFASVLVGLLAWWIADARQGGSLLGSRSNGLFPTLWVVNMLVVFGLGAYFLDYERLYIIGAMYALPVPADVWLIGKAGPGLTFIAFAVPSAFILVMGAAVLLRFLRDHPILERASYGNL
jgi:hypothetical protein